MGIHSKYLYPRRDASWSWNRLLAILPFVKYSRKEGIRRFILFSEVTLCLKAGTKKEG